MSMLNPNSGRKGDGTTTVVRSNETRYTINNGSEAIVGQINL